MSWLVAAFAGTALLYASVGFGGGSTYTALLVLAGTDYRIVPIVSLACNIVVVTGGTIAYWRAGQLPLRRLWPILLLSAPCAWAGGFLPVEKSLFVLLLGLSLLVAGALILIQQSRDDAPAQPIAADWANWPVGMAIGLLSGIVGIGGGIFLAPVLHLLRWDRPRRIAGAASAFILVNSLAGIGGQFAKTGVSGVAAIASGHWPLLVAVFAGGLAGSALGTRILPQRWVRLATAVLILYVAVRLLLVGKQ